MPELTHLNNEMNVINKRLVKSMLRQAQVQMPDVPVAPVDSDVSVNYMSLMKSLTTILLSLREMFAYRFGIQPEGEADYEEYDFGDEQSFIDPFQASEGSVQGSVQGSEGSQFSYAPFGSQASAPVPVRALSQASAPEVLFGYPRQNLSQSEPRRAEQSIQDNIDYARGNSVVLNSLTREVVNCQFLVEELPFEQLSKIQKQKLKVIIVKINKVKGVINIGVSKPIYTKLNKILTRIASSLTSEGSTTEFLLRTEDEMAPVESNELIGFGRVASGRICGSTTSVYGAGRKHPMLSPAMFAAHNVNQLFSHSLAKRNN
jgi:hypothetical protein